LGPFAIGNHIFGPILPWATNVSLKDLGPFAQRKLQIFLFEKTSKVPWHLSYLSFASTLASSTLIILFIKNLRFF